MSNPKFFDPKFVDPFVTATKVTIETQVGLKVEVEKPFLKSPNQKLAGVDISGIINLDSTHFKGVIAICFAEKTFLGIYEKMTGEKHEKLNDDTKDGAGELMNIIFGQAKKEISEKFQVSMGMVIPTVLVGTNIEVIFKSELPTIIMPFKCDAGSFHVELILDQRAAMAAA